MIEVLDVAVLTPIVVGLVEVAKRTRLVPSRFLPLTALCVGSVLAYFSGGDFMAGLVVGLSAVGLFSSVKNTAVISLTEKP